MITIRDFMETVNYRITEGSDYTWPCYGDSAYSLDSWDGDNDEGYSVSIVFDLKNQTVYEMTACDYKNRRAYRWINPDYRTAHEKYGKDRHSEYMNQAWDDVDYNELETEEDMLEKASAIVDGRDYDTRISVPIDLPEDEMLRLFKLAHERDMTFNDFIEEALRQSIEEYKRDPKGFTARTDLWKEQNDIA